MTRAAELREMAALLEEWGMERGDARSTALEMLGYQSPHFDMNAILKGIERGMGLLQKRPSAYCKFLAHKAERQKSSPS